METTRLLDDSDFGATSHRSGAFVADGLSFMHTGHTVEPVMQLPIGSRRRFLVAGSYPFPLKPSNVSTPLDSTCQHHPFTTPPGVS